jgi:hypothetical protein
LESKTTQRPKQLTNLNNTVLLNVGIQFKAPVFDVTEGLHRNLNQDSKKIPKRFKHIFAYSF